MKSNGVEPARTDRHRQLAFACDAAGAVLLAGDRVEAVCPHCGAPVDGSFAIARIFRTGSITVFDGAGKQRHLFGGSFRFSRWGGMNSHAIIHIAKKQLGMDDAAYRLMLERVAGKPSIAAMNEAERGRVVDELKRLGFRVATKAKAGRRKASEKAYVRLIFALWRSIGEKGGLDDGSAAALKSFVQKRTGVADPEWLTYEQADPIIRALKAMEKRASAPAE